LSLEAGNGSGTITSPAELPGRGRPGGHLKTGAPSSESLSTTDMIGELARISRKSGVQA